MTILSSREEERTKRRRPRGLARGMEPHRIARLTSAKKNTVERRGGVIREDEKWTAGGPPHWRRWRAKEMTEKGVRRRWHQRQRRAGRQPRSEEAADGRRREGEQAEGPEWLVDNGGWRRQERSVAGATSNKRERGGEEDAVTMSAAMLLRWGADGRLHEASRQRMVLPHGEGGGRQWQATRAGIRRRGGVAQN